MKNCFGCQLQLRRCLLGSVLILGATLGMSNPAEAESVVVPDGTLGAESSVVTDLDALNQLIEGGAVRGSNLFHSFSEFNVTEGHGVYFANPAAIESILTRVTGANPSNIFGTLGVNGLADLFLMNPNGIVFGENASLSINGSFYATTATAIPLGNGLFSATAPQSSSLLAVSPEATFLNFITEVSGDIENKGELFAGRTLNLSANNLDIQGRLQSRGDLILLATQLITMKNGAVIYIINNGIGQSGNIRIESDTLSVSERTLITTRTISEGDSGNIFFKADLATFDSSRVQTEAFSNTGNGGQILLDLGGLNVTNGSQIAAYTFSEGNAGSLLANVTGDIVVDGQILGFVNGQVTNSPSAILNVVFEGSSGDGGLLRLNANNLRISNGGQIGSLAAVEEEATAGNVEIYVSNSIDILGNPLVWTGFVGILTQNGFDIDDTSFSGEGNPGNIFVQSNRINIRDGGQIWAISEAEANQGGQITIQANETIVLNGVGTSVLGNGIPSGILTTSAENSSSGQINIDTESLFVQDGAVISTATFGTGDGGALFINANQIEVIGTSPIEIIPSAITSDTFSREGGDAGNLLLTVDRLIVGDGGAVSSSSTGSGTGGQLVINAEDSIYLYGTSDSGASSGIYSQAFGSGDAQGIEIHADNIDIEDQATIAAASQSLSQSGFDPSLLRFSTDIFEVSIPTEATGNAGKIKIVTDTISLLDEANITALASQASAESIEIQASHIFLDNSDITTNVFSGVEDGGNILLVSDSILAFEDSDILAFAQDGRGGNITLDTPAFFGENYIPGAPPPFEDNDRVDVNASGAVDGVITSPDVSFIEDSLTELPESLVDPDALISNSCIARNSNRVEGSFTLTGLSSLPQQPGDTGFATFSTGDVQTIPTDADATDTATEEGADEWQLGDEIVEPNGVYQLTSGRFVLGYGCDEAPDATLLP